MKTRIPSLLAGGLLALTANQAVAELTSKSKGLLEAGNVNESALLQKLGVHLGGWIDAGVTYNANDPGDKFNGPTSYADRDSELQMNQLYLYAEKAVNREGSEWDLGGRVDFMFGTDAYKTQSFNHFDSSLISSKDLRFYDIAFPQAYLEAFAPIGNGLSIKAGHFYTIVGKEGVTAPGNFFYSRNYSFTWAGPFTHTGVLLNYPVNNNISVDAGGVMGWDNVDNQAGAWNFLGGVKLNNDDNSTSASLHVVTGDYSETVSANRTRYTLLINHDFTDRIHYTFQHDYAFQDQHPLLLGKTAHWYGINNFLTYDIDDKIAAGLRAEWFRDHDGVRVTQNTRGGPLNGSSGYYALTAGLNYKPLGWLNIRPEVRYDWADKAKAFDAGNKTDQFTFSTDIIVNF
jgi:Putative beta-barrel porin-2, OmpL-like. bbp2